MTPAGIPAAAAAGRRVQRGHTVGGVQTGQQRVHRDAVARDLTRECAQEAGEPGAGGVREDERRDRLAHRDRRDRDHSPPLARLHLGNGLVTHRDRAVAVQFEGVEVLIDRRVREVAGRRAARVEHEDVDPAERGPRVADETGRAVDGGDVGDDRDRIAAEAGGRAVDGVAVATADRDLHPFGRERPRDPETQALRCRGDRSPLPGDSEIHRETSSTTRNAVCA